MIADTFAAPENTEHFKLSWLATLKLLVSGRSNNRKALLADRLPESHYRDLGLPMHRHDAADTRPHIILEPM